MKILYLLLTPVASLIQYGQGFAMYISRTSGYAMHALCCIENGAGKPCFVRDVAARTGLKKPYLAKIINQLVHHGFLLAKRGYRGGVALARSPDKISLMEIVQAIEGDRWRHACLFGLEGCPCHAFCPAHAVWQEMQTKLERLLRTTTLAQVIKTIHPRKKNLGVARRVVALERTPIDLLFPFGFEASVPANAVKPLCSASGG